MSYTSFSFYVMIAALLVLYYLFPKNYRWNVLLAGSVLFYVRVSSRMMDLVVFTGTILVSWLAGILLEKKKSRGILVAGILISAIPFLYARVTGLFDNLWQFSVILPVGLSFYTLQIISYLVDIYHRKIHSQKNLLKYALFVSFFPQILQGPIPRYEDLGKQLYEGHDYDRDQVIRGMQLIVWGFFLKFMIADKAGTAVDAIFNRVDLYQGAYGWLGGILYSFQLYADFSGAASMSIGMAEMFGIHLTENFNHPYFAVSIQDFWRRWHISLSTWLREYIYIPLGGNRKGKARKNLNLLITFAASGFWHGMGVKYLAWGMVHGFYQMMGSLTYTLREKIYAFCGMKEDSASKRTLKRLGTFFWVMLAWIIFRADTLSDAWTLLHSMITVWNPEALRTASLVQLGLSMNEWMILLGSLSVLLSASIHQEKGKIRDWLNKQALPVRWLLIIGMIWIIWVFGTYGYGYHAADFIYGGF